MTSHVPKPHTPAEMRTFSNLGHDIEGAIISGSGTLMLLDSLASDRRLHKASSNLLAGAGSLLGLGLIGGSFDHGGPVTFFMADLQQRQHLEMAALLTTGGLARRAGRFGSLVWGAALARIGQMFLTHEQHGSGEAAAIARGMHQRLGRTILAAAVTVTAGELTRSRWLRAVGSALPIASGIQLAIYREPVGAFEVEHGAHHEM